MKWEDSIDEKPHTTDKSAVAIRSNIAQVESALSEFDKISNGLAELAERFPPDLAFDVTTTKGMAEAVAHRAAWRDPRINVEKLRRMAKAPVLALGKDIDARAAWLTEQLLVGETPVHEQIKAEESRKEAEKQARVNAEFGRVTAMQEAIGEIAMEAMAVIGKPSSMVAERLEKIRSAVLDPLVFQEMLPEAKAAQAAAIVKMEITLKAQLFTEAEAAKMAADRAELEELRAAAAAQKLKDDEARAQAAQVEQDRIAAEQHAAREERRRQDEASSLARAEADRVAAEGRRVAQEAHEAEMRVQREALAEQTRIAEEKAAKELAKKRKAEAADRKVRDAAQTMLAALREIRPFVSSCDGSEQSCIVIDAAIKEATGQ